MTELTPATRRVAAIDCGTNSLRLLVADLTSTAAGITMVDVHRELRVVRLGEGVDRTGRLSPGALDRTWAALADYTAILRASGAGAVRMAATSATRDAVNRGEFEALVQRVLGQPPEIITGREEAELSFRGAVAELDPAAGPFLVVDIGGGSTELVVGAAPDRPGNAGVSIAGAVSVDVGSVRITERLLPSDPPRPAEITAARRFAIETLLPAVRAIPVERVRTVVMVAGTPTTVAAAALRLTGYDPARLHLSELAFDEMEEAGTFLLSANRSHRAMLPYMHPGRVDVIGGGAIILQVLLRLISERASVRRLIVSEHDILDGLALSLA